MRNARTWIGRGFWAVADQALFAGGNFLVSVLLARLLEPKAYGAVSLAYAVLLLFGTLQSAFLNEPMMVYGSGRLRDRFGRYKRILAKANWVLGLLTATLFALVGAVGHARGEELLAWSFWGFALAVPLVFALWFERQSAYVLLEPHKSAAGGAAYLALYLGLALLLSHQGLLNAFSAPVLMGVASLAAMRLLLGLISLKEGTLPNPSLDAGAVYREHWRYGRWAAMTAVLGWVPGYLPFLLLPFFHGLEATARLRALLNLMMPIWHFNGALSRLLVPALVRALSRGRAPSVAWRAFLALGGFATLYWLLMAVAGEAVVDALYGGLYTQDAYLLRVLGLGPVLGAAVAVMVAWMRAQENPRAVAYASILAVGPSIPLLVFLGWRWEVSGIISYLLLKEMSTIAFLGIALKKKWTPLYK